MSTMKKILVMIIMMFICGSSFPVSAEELPKSFVDEMIYDTLPFAEDPTDEFFNEKHEINQACMIEEGADLSAAIHELHIKLQNLKARQTTRYGSEYVDWEVAFFGNKLLSWNGEWIFLINLQRYLAESNGNNLKKVFQEESTWKNFQSEINQLIGEYVPIELDFRMGQKFVDLCTDFFGESNSITLKYEMDLIQDYSLLGDSKVALEMEKKLLPKLEEAFGKKSREVATLLQIMANDYKVLGNYLESEKTLLKAIAINKELQGEESAPEILANIIALIELKGATPDSDASLYNALEKAAKNLPESDLYKFGYFRVKILNKPVHNMERLVDLSLVGAKERNSIDFFRKDDYVRVVDISLEQSESARALGLYEHSLFSDLMAMADSRMDLGKYHHKTLSSICNLSEDYLMMNQIEDALMLAQTAFNTSQKIYGNEHPCTIYALHSLTNVYRKMGRYDDALKKDLEAYELCAKTFVKSSAGEPQENLTVLMDIAADHKGLKNYPEAIKLYEQILLSFDSNDRLAIKIAEVRQNLAYLYNRSGEYEKTVKLYDFLKKDDYFYSLNKLKVRGLIAAYTANVLGDALAVVGKKSADKYHIAHYIYYQSIEELEDMRSDDQDFYSEVTYSTSENRQGWFSQTVPYYQKAATFFLNQDDNDEAFRAIELCKGRTLADQYSDLLAIYKGGLSDSEIVKLNEYQKKSLQYKDKFSKEFNHGSDNLKFNLMLAQLGTMKDYIS